MAEGVKRYKLLVMKNVRTGDVEKFTTGRSLMIK